MFKIQQIHKAAYIFMKRHYNILKVKANQCKLYIFIIT